MLNTLRRRLPLLEIILAPSPVQGIEAPAALVQAIHFLNTQSPDVILLARGGGSIEDLWAFNEEVVARAIFESALPVVSAVGHEIDFTISDFVADVRAATPSAAAEIITEDVFASRQFLAGAAEWMARRARKRLEHEQADLDTLLGRLARAHPLRLLNEKLQRLDDLRTSLLRSMKYRWRACHAAWQTAHQRLRRFHWRRRLDRCAENLNALARQLVERLHQQLRDRRGRLETIEARLRLLSPANVLERGYSITMDAATGQVVRDASDVQSGQQLRTRVKQGEIRSIVEG